MTRPVLLVGSIPMQSAETVFREVSERVGPILKRVPDGETGERSAWTAWQGKVIERAEGVVQSGARDLHGILYPTYALKPGMRAAEIKFGDLGYATCRSRVLQRLRAAARTRLQSPSPLSTQPADPAGGRASLFLGQSGPAGDLRRL